MKTLQDLYRSSSISFAFINTTVPSPEFDEILENVTGSEYNVVFVPSGTSHLFEAIYPQYQFEESEKESVLDIIADLKGFFENITVVDFSNKQDLYEEVNFVGVPPVFVTEKTKAQIALEQKSFANFSRLFESADEAALRKVYSFINPPTRYSSFIKETTETREQFYTGQLYPVGSTVLVEEKTCEVLDRGSNYLVVVDESGNTTKKFVDQVQESKEKMVFEDFSYFKGFTPADQFFERTEIKEAFDKTIELYRDGQITDPYAILKSVKLVNSYLLDEEVDVSQIKYSLSKIGQLHSHTYINEMSTQDPAAQLQAAKIIAGAVGSSTDGKSATEIVNRAISKAKSSSNQTQLQILKKMLVTASKVGLKYDTSLLESTDDRFVAIHRHQKLLKEKPTSEVLSAHRDMRKIGVDYDARDVGGKRAMVKDILDHNYGPRDVSSYKSLKANIRRAMDEEVVNIEELSTEKLSQYNRKAMQDTLSGKKDRNKGMSKAYSRLSGTNKPLLDPKKKYVSETTGYGSARAIEHDYSREGGVAVPKPATYKLIHKASKKVISTHKSAPEAVTARNKLKGTMDTHSIVKESKLDEVHLDPDYQEEIDVLGYDGLKKNLKKMTGIQNYGEQEPGKEIDLVDKDGVVVKDHHTKPGFSLKATSETNRKMKVQKLKGE